MTRQNFYKKLKITLTLILSLICLISCSVICLTACGGSSSNDSEDKYAYRYDTEYKIVNGNFNVNTYKVEDDDYPVTSPSDWSLTVDNSATTSTISSGVINVNTSTVEDEDSWRTLLKTLYNDKDFLTYLRDELGLGTEDKLPTSLSKDETVKRLYEQYFTTPKTYPGSTDNNVIMINNYNAKNLSTGTAQKATSNTTITLEKGTIGKISVWVKTYNLKSIFNDGHAGANVRLISTFGGVEQALYAVYGIDTTNVVDNNGWQKVEMYVQADKDYDCTIKVVLGLGFGNSNSSYANDYVQGTAFFDDVRFEEVDALPEGKTAVTTSLKYETEKSDVRNFLDINNLTSDEYFLYDMTLDTGSFYEQLYLDDAKITYDFTTSNNATSTTSQTLFSDSTATVTPNIDKTNQVNELKFNLNKASYTLEIDNTLFSLNPDEYVLLKFTIKNNLSRFDKNGITVLAKDYTAHTQLLTTVMNVTDRENETVCTVLVKNNFGAGTGARTFKLLVVIGPTTLSSTDATNYASGEVIIKDLMYSKDVVPEDTDADYDLYQLFTGSPNATISLHAGEDDFTEEAEANYSIKASGGNMGQITYGPTNAIGYAGITSNHNYISSASNNYKINTRIGNGDGAGNYAGLINTKYLSSYQTNLGLDISANIGSYTDDFQPLMIYNSETTPNAYGFIGNSIKLTSSSTKVISVTLRVVGDAKAYVYLADLSGVDKNVMSLTFNSNTDGKNYTTPSETVSGGDLSIEGITANDMQSNGWLTVNFYIATGDNEKNFRVEVWNGSRDYSETDGTGTASSGYVFIKDVQTSGTFNEPTSLAAAVDGTSDNPLYNAIKNGYASIMDSAVLYKRVLDGTEIEYNKTHTGDDAVSYDAKYIWAKNENMVYAIFNSIEPVAVDPNQDDTTDEDTGSGCQAESDPATFWLSFSSILLAGVLVLAIVMLVVKNIRRRRKARQSDAKSYYKVTSRASMHKANTERVKNKKAKKLEEVTEEEQSTVTEEVTENVDEVTAETIDTENETEEKVDEYVYDDVQEFGVEEQPNNDENN